MAKILDEDHPFSPNTMTATVDRKDGKNLLLLDLPEGVRGQLQALIATNSDESATTLYLLNCVTQATYDACVQRCRVGTLNQI